MKKDKALLFAILFLAFALRFTASWFGLPYLYHADEPIIVNHALAYGTGDLNPHFFKIPPLVSYLLFGVYGLFYLLGHLAGKFSNPQAFEFLFYSDPSSFYFMARFIFGVLAGTLTVCVFYRLIARHFSAKTAVIAAALMAVNFLHVSHSHYLYADIPLVLVMTAAFFIFFKLPDKPGGGVYFWSGAMIGLGAAVKYNGVFLAIPYLFLAMTVPRKQAGGRILLAGISAAAVFFLLNPFAVLDSHFFLAELKKQTLSNSGVPWKHHLHYFIIEGFGKPLLVLASLGMGRLFFAWNFKKGALALFIVSYYGILIGGSQPYERYLLPLIPFLIFFAADFLSWLSERGRPALILSAVFFLSAFAPSVIQSVYFDRLMLASDTRTLAREWVLQNIPPGTALALDQDFYMPRLSFSKNTLEEKKKELPANPDVFSAARARRLDFLLTQNQDPGYDLNFFTTELSKAEPSFFAQPLVIYDLDRLRARSIQYVLIQGGIDRPSGPLSFYHQLKLGFPKVAEFNPYRNPSYKSPSHDLLDLTTWQLTGGPFKWEELRNRDRNGPRIEIYKIQ